MKRVFLKKTDLEEEKILREKRWNGNRLFFYRQDYILKYNKDLTKNDIKTLKYIDEEQSALSTIKELLIPEKIAIYRFKKVGSIAKRGYLDTLKQKEMFSFEEQIMILRNLGEVLQKLEMLRKKEKGLKDFAIGDLQPENILVEKESKKIQICDLDSVKIKDNEPYLTKYFSGPIYTRISDLNEKYPYASWGKIIPNQDSDYFAYIIMIFEVLFSEKITILSRREYDTLLEELLKNGLPKPLFEIFSKVYTKEKNENPYSYLEYIPSKLEKRKEKI